MEKIKNLSVRKTILLYMAVALLCSFLLSAVIVRVATQTQRQIWWNYVEEESYYDALDNEGRNYVVDIPRPNATEMTRSDHFVSELCDFLQTYTVLLLSIMGSCMAVLGFYRNKLKTPIDELEQASKNISRNNLDFHINYANKDEMGQLCKEFERMREQLVQNNRMLWKMIDEEKALRAAIAHDIRSPLSVLKGYQEMLMEYLPNGDIDMGQAKDMLSASMVQIERMDVFVESMQKMSSLEKRKLVTQEISAERLKEDIQTELFVLEKKSGKQCVLQVMQTDEVFYGDKEIILEVVENLLLNALRYAKHKVEITVWLEHSELKVCVKDDGNGFGEDAEKITEAFHQQNIKDSLKHTGLGMYISRLYCEKHGGKLVLENDGSSGAVVTAIFRRVA